MTGRGLLLAGLLGACHISSPSPAEPPGEGEELGRCFLSTMTVPDDVALPEPGLRVCDDVSPATGNDPCQCENFGGQYQDDVIDFAQTSVNDADGLIEVPQEGCNASTHFMWPACSHIAQASGRVASEPHAGLEGPAQATGDDDLTFDLCPDQSTMQVDPPGGSRMEIRSYDSFLNRAARGSIHIEIQDCRLYDGSYFLTDPRDESVYLAPSRPQQFDHVSVAGDWITDDAQNYVPLGPDGEPLFYDYHTGWTEIHEARALAVVRAAEPDLDLSDTYYAFFNGIFELDTNQANNLHLDIQIPPPVRADANALDCDWVDPPQTRPCARHSNIIIDPPMADFATGTCTVSVHRDLDMPCEPSDTTCYTPESGFDCYEACQGSGFAEDYDDGSPAFACKQVALARPIRAVYSDPGDLWVCRTCACADPSAEGAVITAPVQGCVTTDVAALWAVPETRAQAEEMACDQVCPGAQICGAAPACVIGACDPPSTGSFAELVGPSACDPSAPQLALRPAPAGDYRIALIGGSQVTIRTASRTVTRPVTGTFHVNVPEGGGLIDFSEMSMDAAAFEMDGRAVSGARIFAAERLIAQVIDGSSFFVPAGEATLALRGTVDGRVAGINTRNPNPFSGTLDLDSGLFTLDFAAVDPEEPDRRIDGTLVGVINNVPPIADASRTPGTVECESSTTTRVRLDGNASDDPDEFDTLSHSQWFTADGSGVSNRAQVDVQLALGTSDFVLHVYDRKLGSDQASHRVRVVDTTPPDLDLEPDEICLWPPDHRRMRFTLGTDISVSATDACDAAPSVRIVAVVSDEPDNGLGDGDVGGDVDFGANTFCVRRERSGLGDGRTYVVIVEAEDASGNTASESMQVFVPHDMSAVAPSGPAGGRLCARAGTPIAETAACE